ncbi:MAG: hypothetical protein OXF75_13560 [Acidimicrobiaceae bacterium]|nr:hypothetical protein [Acidimicrobiaceae bacterium]
MKAITLWQPYASLVAARIKASETRGWPPPESVIGERIAIHAAARRLTAPAHNRLPFPVREAAFPLWLNSGWRMPYGAVVATATVTAAGRVIDRIRNGSEGTILSQDEGTVYHFEDDGLGDYSVGRWVWSLEDVEPLAEPVPARGQQGIWNWEPQNLASSAD